MECVGEPHDKELTRKAILLLMTMQACISDKWPAAIIRASLALKSDKVWSQTFQHTAALQMLCVH